MAEPIVKNEYDQQALDAAKKYYEDNPEATAGSSDQYGAVIKDKKTGESIGYATPKMMQKLPSGGGTVYQNPNTGEWFTNKASATPAPTITFDKSIGRITVNAPSDYLNSDYFQKRKTDLEFLSSNYKLNPDYKYPDPEDDSKTYNIEEEINRIQDGMQKEYKIYASINEFRNSLAKNNPGAAGFSDEQIVIAAHQPYDVGDTKVSESTRVYVPKVLADRDLMNSGGKTISTLDTWDEETGTVELGDFRKNFWNLGNLSRDKLNEAMGMLNAMINNDQYGEDTYEGEEGEEIYNVVGKTEIAKAISFRNLMLNSDPDGNIFEEVGSAIESGAVNFGMRFSQVYMGIAGAVQNAADAITGNLNANYGAVKTYADMDETLNWYNSTEELVSDAAVAVGQVAGFAGTIGGYVSAYWLGGKVVGGIGKGASAVAGAMTDTAALAKGAESLSVGMRMVVGLCNATQKIELFEKSAKILQAINSVSGTVKGIPVVGSALNLLADSVVDTIISDPVAMRDILKGGTREIVNEDGTKTTQDLYAYGMEQLSNNFKMSMVFRGAGLAVKGAGKTKVGRAANQKLSQAIMRAHAWAGDADFAVKSKIFAKGTEKDIIDHLEAKAKKATPESAKQRRLTKKADTQKKFAILRNAQRNYAEMDFRLPGESLEDSLKRLESRQTAIMNWQRAIDQYDRAKTDIAVMLSDPNRSYFTGTTAQKVQESLDKVADMSAKYGGTFDKYHRMLSKEASNYVGLTEEIAEYRAISNSKSPNADRARQVADDMQARLDLIKENMPLDYQEALDNYLDASRKNYAALNEYSTSADDGALKNKVKLTEYEESEASIGKDWIRLGRVQEESDLIIKTKSGTVARDTELTDYKLRYDAEGDFIDPEITRADFINDIAEVKANHDFAVAGIEALGAASKIEVGGEATEYMRKIMENKGVLANSVKERISQTNFADSLELKDIRSNAKSESSSMTKRRSSVAARSSAIQNMDATQVSAALQGMGYTSGTLIQPILEIHTENLAPEGRAIEYADGAKGAVDNAEANVVAEDAIFKEWEDGLNDNARAYLRDRKINDLASLQTEIKTRGEDFTTELGRNYLLGEKRFRDSDVVKLMAENQAVTNEEIFGATTLKDAKNSLKSYSKKLPDGVDGTVRGFRNLSDEIIEDTVERTASDDATRKVSETLASESTGTDADTVARYAALKEMQKTSNRAAAHKRIDELLDETYSDASLTPAERKKVYKEAHEVYDRMLDQKTWSVQQTLAESNSPIIDRADMYSEAKKLDAKITGFEADDAMIQVTDPETGAAVFYRVDPALASLYNRKQVLSLDKAGALAKANYAMSRTFRFGTTVANLKSFGNQMFKDTGNAVYVGGAFKTIQACADELRDVFGDDVIEYIKNYRPYEYKQIEAASAEKGISMRQELANRAQAEAAAKSGATTQHELYKEFRKRVYGDTSENMWGSFRNTVDNVADKVDKVMNGKRENYLRKRVYMNNLNEGLRRGMSIKDARVYAEFFQANATTNFGRSLYHLQSISESTPYFSAAVNGTKSFWRMWEFDPVGITGRIMGGLVIPIMYFTGQSLSDPENREVYKNIPEYERESAINIIVNGQKHSIPLPEELRSLISPWRHLVEDMWQSSKGTFWQLLSNDLLGLHPLDLQGFSTVDLETMGKNVTPLDMAGRGFSRLFSQAAPVPAKTLYMTLTGVDPYTGKKLGDPSYAYWDEETNSPQTMDYNQNRLAIALSRLGLFNASPELGERVISGIFGSTGSDILGWLTGLFEASVDATKTDKELAEEGKKRYEFGDVLKTATEDVVTKATSPFGGKVYNQINSEWRRAVRSKTAEKNELINNSKVKAILTEIGKETDPEKRRNLYNKLHDYTDKYEDGVRKMVEDLQSMGGDFDRYKYQAVLQLLNYNTDPTFARNNAYARDLANDNFMENGRSYAISTMERLGIKGVDDFSIFGYIGKDWRTGKVEMKYNEPIAILNAKNISGDAKKIHLANITSAIEGAELKNKKKAIDNQIDAVYDEKNIKYNDRKNKADAIRINWNAEVMKTIAPYVEQMSPEAAINDKDIINYLSEYIYVPDAYKKDSKGKSVSDKKLGEGSAKDAYIKNYIRSIWQVNNERYSTGKNYSGRKTLGVK